MRLEDRDPLVEVDEHDAAATFMLLFESPFIDTLLLELADDFFLDLAMEDEDAAVKVFLVWRNFFKLGQYKKNNILINASDQIFHKLICYSQPFILFVRIVLSFTHSFSLDFTKLTI